MNTRNSKIEIDCMKSFDIKLQTSSSSGIAIFSYKVRVSNKHYAERLRHFEMIGALLFLIKHRRMAVVFTSFDIYWCIEANSISK